MSLKTRLKKLEPVYKKAWKDAWDVVTDPPNSDFYFEQEETLRERHAALSEAELKDYGERFQKDQETHFPALVAADGADLLDWLERTDAWMREGGFSFDEPNYSLWPWQAPRPPDIPEEVVRALREGGRRYGEFSGDYAGWMVKVLWAEAFRRAIEEHEAAKDE